MAEPLWASSEILTATGGRSVGAPFEAGGVTFDTRELQPGDLFVALAGARDGHDFVPQALAAGAAAALVSQPVGDGPQVVVDDTLAALERLGEAARDRAPARRAAVTGSVGKTSVTQAIAAALRLAGPSHSSVKSFNNHIGVPLTLARMPRGTQRAVFEIGMNHADEIRPLSRLVRPHVAVVTNVGSAHIENFADGEAGVARAKAEIFDGLEPGGLAVIPADGRWAAFLRGAAETVGARVATFGTSGDADARLLPSSVGGEASFRATLHGEEIAFRVGQSGAHWGPNGLAVLLACDALGAPRETVLQALAAFGPLAGRGQERRVALAGGAFTLVDESYNANPVSMRAVLDTLSRRVVAEGGRRVVVLTDMLELGSEGERLHADLARAVTDAGVDLAFSAGPLMRAFHDALPPERRGAWSPTAAELEPVVAEAVRPGDVVVVKGSNGSKASQVVRALEALGAASGGEP